MIRKLNTALLWTAVVAAFALCQGCNTYSQAYKPTTTETFQPTQQVELAPFSTTDQLVQRMRQGYRIIGMSNFVANQGMATDKQAEQAGMKAGANLVMISKASAGTSTGILPVTTYKSGESAIVSTNSNYSGSANVYGTSGYNTVNGSVSGNSTSLITTSGSTQTNYVPFTVTRNSHLAVFLRKVDTSQVRLGIHFTTIDAETRKKIQSNAGTGVWFVYRNTPAFDADILDGDVILEVNGKRVSSEQDARDILSPMPSGATATFKIWRNGNTLQKQVKLR